MKSHALVAVAAVISLVLLFGPTTEAQQPKSLDEQLLEDLNKDPVDEFDRELFSQPNKSEEMGQPDEAAENREADPGLDEQLRRELGQAAESQPDSPLLTVARTMRQAGERIAKADSGNETQELQSRVLTNLEELLQQCRSQCQGGGKPSDKPGQKVAPRQTVAQPKPGKPKHKASGGGRDPTPAIASQNKYGPGPTPSQQPSREEWADLVKALWGELPEREREQMAQFFDEEFLPKYELLIEQYFRRLAEEQGKN